MEIKEIDNKDVWENFLLNHQEKTFLDSWNWAEFQKKQGNEIKRLGIYDNNELAGIALVIIVKAKRGRFLFLSHSPIMKSKRLILLKNIRKLESFSTSDAQWETSSISREKRVLM